MIPAADFGWTETGYQSTFVLTNEAPQRQSVNAGRWRQLENAIRRLAASADLVQVITGTLFESDPVEYLSPGGVAAPTHTYKAILVMEGDRKRMFAAILPNGVNPGEPLNYFAVTVDELERRSKLDLFDFLDDVEEEALESKVELFP